MLFVVLNASGELTHHVQLQELQQATTAGFRDGVQVAAARIPVLEEIAIGIQLHHFKAVHQDHVAVVVVLVAGPGLHATEEVAAVERSASLVVLETVSDQEPLTGELVLGLVRLQDVLHQAVEGQHVFGRLCGRDTRGRVETRGQMVEILFDGHDVKVVVFESLCTDARRVEVGQSRFQRC